MARSIVLTAVLTATAATASVSAHDFWLAATSVAGPPRVFTVTGNVGETFPTADTNVTPDRVDAWRIIGPGGESLTTTADFVQAGQSVATSAALPMRGPYLGVMTIKPREIEMTGDEFTEYLLEEGLTRIVADRARHGKATTKARERYARYAKIVVGNGEGTSAHLMERVGAKAEFVPLRNPSRLLPGDTFAVQLLVEGRPVSGAQVSALTHGVKLNARTDEEGVAAFITSKPGPWLIRTVHMEARDAASPVDWESYWVSLSFEISEQTR
ncbi:MAG: DUF4198 domain-containing protein [Vicinamibacterales bacterium]